MIKLFMNHYVLHFGTEKRLVRLRVYCEGPRYWTRLYNR